MADYKPGSIQHIVAVHTEANVLLTRYGLAQQGWTFRLSNTKRAVGYCHFTSREIEFSKWFLSSPPEDITDTLLHEIAHALVGKGHGHDDVWKAKAIEIGANPSHKTETAKTKAPFNFMLKCPTCDRKWYRYRLKRSIIGRAMCPRCNIALEAYKINH